MADGTMPTLWWSPTGGLIRGGTNGGYDDAVLLGPAEPVDDKGRTPTYRRGFEDGRMAGLAGAGPLPDPVRSYLSAYARAAIDHRAAERSAKS